MTRKNVFFGAVFAFFLPNASIANDATLARGYLKDALTCSIKIAKTYARQLDEAAQAVAIASFNTCESKWILASNWQAKNLRTKGLDVSDDDAFQSTKKIAIETLTVRVFQIRSTF